MVQSQQVINAIESVHLEMLNRAVAMGLTENFEIHLSPTIAEELGWADSIILNGVEVRVIPDSAIADNGQSDIYIFDPKWSEENN